MGCLNYKELTLRHPPVNYVKEGAADLSDNTPVYSRISKGSNGVEISAFANHASVLDLPAWSFAKKLINKEYFESL